MLIEWRSNSREDANRTLGGIDPSDWSSTAGSLNAGDDSESSSLDGSWLFASLSGVFCCWLLVAVGVVTCASLGVGEVVECSSGGTGSGSTVSTESCLAATFFLLRPLVTLTRSASGELRSASSKSLLSFLFLALLVFVALAGFAGALPSFLVLFFLPGEPMVML